MKLKYVFALMAFCSPIAALASPPNYNSLMIGDRSAGMGGAGSALAGDVAAAPYLNPALLSRVEGTSVSAAISLFNKNDIVYGEQESLDDAVFRINKGSIVPIPASSAILSSFRNFTAGLSIVSPHDLKFGGTVAEEDDDTTFLRTDQQSLWVGGVFAFNIDESWSWGMTAYYTSDNNTRSLTNRYDNAGDVVVVNEEKTLTANNVIYILGAQWTDNARWRLGLSYRFESLPVDGKGSFLRSQVGTGSGAQPVEEDHNLDAEIRVPPRINFGISYSSQNRWTFAFDVSYHGAQRYNDSSRYSDVIVRREVINYAFGAEYKANDWLDLRAGLFTDFSAAPEIPVSPSRRYEDHIDQVGFTANAKIATSDQTTLTLGGYYSGGEGQASEEIGPGFERIDKTQRVFSFLVGTAYRF